MTLTAYMNAAGRAVSSESQGRRPRRTRYAVATHRAIMARVWLLQEKYRQTIWNPLSLTMANQVSRPPPAAGAR